MDNGSASICHLQFSKDATGFDVEFATCNMKPWMNATYFYQEGEYKATGVWGPNDELYLTGKAAHPYQDAFWQKLSTEDGKLATILTGNRGRSWIDHESDATCGLLERNGWTGYDLPDDCKIENWNGDFTFEEGSDEPVGIYGQNQDLYIFDIEPRF